MDNILYSLLCILPLIIFIKLAITLKYYSSFKTSTYNQHKQQHDNHHHTSIVIINSNQFNQNIIKSSLDQQSFSDHKEN